MVSIITSVYNCEDYIESMIKSIINQTYSEWEMIIIEDDSIDQTLKVLHKFQDMRIKVIHNTENCGLTVNLNRAIEMAKGEYILRIDGDDIAYPDRVEKQVNYMEQHQDIALAGCWMRTFGASKTICQSSVDDARLRIKLLFNACMYHPTFIVRKTVIDQHHIRYNERLRYAQDYDFEYSVSKVAKLGNLPEILMHYRVHENQITQSKYKQQLECANMTRKKILNDLQVDISDTDLEIWSSFCLDEIKEPKEYKKAEEIIEKILKANERLTLYDSTLLKETMRIHKERNCCCKEKMDEVAVSYKYSVLYQQLYLWQRARNRGGSLENYLEKQGIHTVAVYGVGYIGRLVYEELLQTSVRIEYMIDQNISENYIDEHISIIQSGNKLPKVDMVIVTPVLMVEDIRQMLQKRVESRIVSIEEIIDEMQ